MLNFFTAEFRRVHTEFRGVRATFSGEEHAEVALNERQYEAIKFW